MDSYVIEITSANVTGGISGLSAGHWWCKCSSNKKRAYRYCTTSITNIRFADTTLTYDMNIVARTGGTFTGFQQYQKI